MLWSNPYWHMPVDLIPKNLLLCNKVILALQRKRLILVSMQNEMQANATFATQWGNIQTSKGFLGPTKE